jgi:hypothetical protein
MITGEFDKAVVVSRGKKTKLQWWNGSGCLLVAVGFALGGWVVVLRMVMCVCVCVTICLVGIGASLLACSLPFVFSTSRVHR